METIAQIVVTKNKDGELQIKLMSEIKVVEDYTSISLDDALDYISDWVRILARS